MSYKETIQSITSYTVGCGGLLVATAANAQALTIILALGIMLMRFIYDVVRLYRFLRKP